VHHIQLGHLADVLEEVLFVPVVFDGLIGPPFVPVIEDAGVGLLPVQTQQHDAFDSQLHRQGQCQCAATESGVVPPCARRRVCSNRPPWGSLVLCPGPISHTLRQSASGQ
jgi:hypothetical protein